MAVTGPLIGLVGAWCFGAVVGWMASHVVEKSIQVDVKWLASMIGILGGGAVTSLFDPKSEFFGAYCIGLFVGFFCRMVLSPVGRWFDQFAQDEREKNLSRAKNRKAKTARNPADQAGN